MARAHITFLPFSTGTHVIWAGFSCTRLVKSIRLVKSNKMEQNVAKTGWELTKVARIGRSRSVYGQKRARSVYGQKRVEGGVGRSREPKLSVCCLRTSAHPFLAKNRPGAPVFGHCPSFICTRYFFCSTWYSDGHVLGCFLLVQG